MCNVEFEDIQHVLFQCDVAQAVFRRICCWWDLDWQEIRSFLEWDAWFLAIRLPSRLKDVLEGVFCAAWWRIWSLRNMLFLTRRLLVVRVCLMISFLGLFYGVLVDVIGRFFFECWLKNPSLISL